MQLRTYLGILLGVLVVVYVSFLTPLNFDLLVQPFQLSSELSVPLYAALLAAFLAGLLPPVTVLLVSSLKQDLSQRRQRRLSREVESLDHRFRRATDFHLDGQLGKAATLLDGLLTERPEHFATLLRLGQVLRQQGKTDEALEVHRRASVLYPRSVALLHQLTEDYDATGEEQVADEIRNRILRDFPDHGLEVQRRRRDLAMAGEQWSEAVQWHEKIGALLKETGDTAGLERERSVAQGLTYQRGMALLEKDRPAEAAAIFRELLEQEPRFIPAGIMLGEAEILQDNDEAALDEWRRGFTQTGSPVFLQRIEDHHIEAEEPARAIETLRSLISQTDNDLLLRFFLGRLYYRLEMHDEALKVLEGIGERLDLSPTYHFLLGRIRQRRNDQRGAMARYLECLKRLGISGATFTCRSCSTRTPEWNDRCVQCGSWNSIALDIQDEQIKAEELGVVNLPVWGGYGSREEAPAETPGEG
ncbi:MAG: tetratricopeptide repeat protein [bacterium]|nr:tetratricopeptide repeat protein [bacterium]